MRYVAFWITIFIVAAIAGGWPWLLVAGAIWLACYVVGFWVQWRRGR